MSNDVQEKALASMPSARALYLRLLKYAARYWLVFLISVVALVIFSATNTGFLAAIKMVTDEGFVKQDSAKLSLLPFMLFGLLAIRALAGFISNFAMRWVARRVVDHTALLGRLQSRSRDFH